MSEPLASDDFGARLVREREWLQALLRRHAGLALLRMEPVEDLAQGVCARALGSSQGFEWRGEPAFRGWLELLALQHLRARRRHWAALRRGGGRLLRHIGENESASRSFGALAASQSGPSTIASRREDVEIAAKALSLLPAGDRAWIESWLEDEPLDQAARARGKTYDAAQRARSRALERLRRLFELVRARRS